MQVSEADEKTTRGLLLTEAIKEKPSIGMVRTRASSTLCSPKMGFWRLGRLMFDVYSALDVIGNCNWAWSSG